MSARTAFEHLADHGEPRGAGAVLDAARRGAVVPHPIPSRRPWSLVLAAVVAVIVVVGAVLVWRVGDENGEVVRTGPGPTAGVPASAPLFGERTNTTLLINDDSGALTAVDLDTGVAQRFPDVGAFAGEGGNDLVRAGDRVIYQGHGETVSLPVDLAGTPTSLGRSDYFRPGGADDRVWLLRLAPTATGSGEKVQLVTLAGDVLVPWTRAGGSADLGVGDYLATTVCVAECAPGIVNHQLENLLTGETVELPQAASAGWGSTLALNGGSTVFHLDDRRQIAAQPSPAVFYNAAVAPDELTVAADHGDGGGQLAGLALIDTETGRWRRVPGSSTGVGAITWTADSRQIFGLAALSRRRARLTHYVMGRPAATVVDLALPAGRVVAVARSDGPLLDTSSTSVCPEAEPISSSAPTTAPSTPGVTRNGARVDPWITVGAPCRLRVG